MEQVPYVEDGAQAINDGDDEREREREQADDGDDEREREREQADNGDDERERERERPYFAVDWKFVTLGVFGVVCIAGGIVVAYLLYKRIRRLEDALSMKATSKLSKRVVSLANTLDGIAKTQGALTQTVKDVMKTQGGLAHKVQDVMKTQGGLTHKVQDVTKTQGGLTHMVKDIAKTQGGLTHMVKDVMKTQGGLVHNVQANSKSIAANRAKVTSVDEKLVKTQRFIVDMAQRQKWPWPFNNRIRGLEEEFGLPKH